MSPAEQRDRFNLSPDEVRHVRRAIIGLEGPVPEPENRWDPPGKSRTEQKVPNVMGLTLAEAEAALQACQFSVGEVAHKDSVLPGDSILAQDPEAEAMALSGTDVNLILSTGLSVRIPDFVGMPLSQALVMLRDAGLKSEPEISFSSNGGYPRGQVIEVSPAMRSYVTPHASVTIQVSGQYQNSKQTRQKS
jgi:beta-lactam-binding protein with PASTA domain